MLKYAEYSGVALAALGFGLLSAGFMLQGFILGVLSCLVLIFYFEKTGQNGLFMLQCYFLIANAYGIYGQ